ncbi:MAG: helix-turn-helix transcriptional regulator [Firmicutes bacterium]|nr:helix-turn-helix transcriptional regulator [Bacillota bacterium]
MAGNQKDLVFDNLNLIILRLLDEGDKTVVQLAKEMELLTSGQSNIPTGKINSVLRKLEDAGFAVWRDIGKNGKQKKQHLVTEMGRTELTRLKAEYEYERTKADSLVSSKAINLSALPPVQRVPKKPRIKKEPSPKKPAAFEPTPLETLFFDANPITPESANIVEEHPPIEASEPIQKSDDTTIYNTTHIYNFIGNQPQPIEGEQPESNQAPIVSEMDTVESTNEPIDSIDSGSVLQSIYDSNATNSYLDNQFVPNESPNFEEPVALVQDSPISDFGFGNFDEYEPDIMEPVLQAAPETTFSEPLNAYESERQQELDRGYRAALLALIKPYKPTIVTKKRVVTQEPIERNVFKTEPIPTAPISPEPDLPMPQEDDLEPPYKEPNFVTQTNAVYSSPDNHENQPYRPTYHHTTVQNNYYTNANQNNTVSEYQQSKNVPANYVSNLPSLERVFTPRVKQEQQKHEFYRYRLKSTRLSILSLIMLLETVLTFLLIVVVFGAKQPTNIDITLYILSLLMVAGVFIYAKVRLHQEPHAKERYPDHKTLKLSVWFTIGIFIVLTVIAFLLNLIFGMPLLTVSNYATSFFLPIILAINAPLNCLIHIALLKSDKYTVGQ